MLSAPVATRPRAAAASLWSLSVEEWQRKTGTLAEFLLTSPLRGADLDLERQHDEPRDLSL